MVCLFHRRNFFVVKFLFGEKANYCNGRIISMTKGIEWLLKYLK